MNKSYRDREDYVGTCALLAAICSADNDKIAEYDEKTGQWYDRLWNARGNYVCEFSNDIHDSSIVGMSVQDALDEFGITTE
jgi:hypothetical protein